MPTQISGYYTSSKEKLLKDFDKTCALMKDALVTRYTEEFVGTLEKAVREEYEKLIPEIPYIKGGRARALNSFLLITAQELSAYKAMEKQGKPPSEAWELCHEALRLNMTKIPSWKKWIMRRIMFSGIMKKIVAKRARKGEKARFGEFEIEYLGGGENNFDFGVNYLQCGNYNFAMKHGGEPFAPYICMSDIVLSDAMGWGLSRTQTLTDGCGYCDFRFKEGAPTQISSKTPEVQDTVEKIRIRESGQ
jgi:hypothetical protein